MLDGDYIGAVHPFEIYDEARVGYLYQTLCHLIQFHVTQGGYENFVINYVFETVNSLQKLKDGVSGLAGDVYTFRLTASRAAIEARIRQREQSSTLDWYLHRSLELVAIQEKAALQGDLGVIIDTTELAPHQVAQTMLAVIDKRES